MTNQEILKAIKGQLIVSCQALEHEPLYNPDFSLMPYMAKAALQAGAKGIRTSGVLDVVEIKKEEKDFLHMRLILKI